MGQRKLHRTVVSTKSELGPGARREIVIRMLRNLASDYEATGQPGKATEAVKLLQLF